MSICVGVANTTGFFGRTTKEGMTFVLGATRIGCSLYEIFIHANYLLDKGTQ